VKIEYMFTKEKELSVPGKLNNLLAQTVKPHCKLSHHNRKNRKCTKSIYGGRGETLKLHICFSAVFSSITTANAGKQRLYSPASIYWYPRYYKTFIKL